MSQMLKSSGALAAATLTSRVLGMVREIVYYAFMGVGMVNGAFTLAFMIPNLFRRLLGEGALTASFIPIFKEKERTETEAEMWRAANAVISGLMAVASIITVLAIAGISIALAAHQYTAKTELMLHLLRIMFPYMLLICLTAVFMGILNARGHFFIPASGAIIMNMVMIGSVYLLAPRMGVTLEKQIFGLAIGVLVAGVAQAAFQLPSLRGEGFRYRWVSPWKDATVRRVVRQMIPGTIGIAAFQINVLTTQSVAFWIDPTIVASFQGAVRLMELPQGVFGVSIATYLLPTLSGLAAEKKYDEYRSTLNQGIDHLVFINLLATILLFILAEPIIRLLFEHGKFVPEDTPLVAWALVCLSPGLIAFSLVNILARAFYALGDTKTPMQVSIFCLLINLIFAFVLIGRYRQGGLGMANSISACLNVSLLFYTLRKKLGKLEFGALRKMLWPIFVAGIFAGATAWFTWHKWDKVFGHGGLAHRLGAVFVPMTLASLVYWAVALLFKVPPAIELGGLVLNQIPLFPKSKPAKPELKT
ncbi:MAG TPA: murein biosynthesis integral membrane protein MurJ [Verrucomicrobiae bacterium]|nr:murein biosynthesis integral membrane protein MurJ [Verrucomicrobiae bacterium]